jgi:hypothetical protein
VLAVASVVILMGCGQTEPRGVSEKRSIDYSKRRKAQATHATIKKTPVTDIGAEAILDNGVDTVLVAINEKALDELVKAANAKDQIGLNLMLLEGQVFLVPCGIRIRILDRGFATSKIRILEGDHYAKAGWIPYEFTRPISP